MLLRIEATLDTNGGISWYSHEGSQVENIKVLSLLRFLTPVQIYESVTHDIDHQNLGWQIGTTLFPT